MATDWFRRGFFDAAMGEILFDAARIEAAQAEVKGLIRMSGLRPGAKVLDLACGTGRHSLEFARRGFEVSGLDLSEAYLKQGQARVRRERLKGIRLERGELLDLYRFQGDFDLVINLFTSFGYYPQASENFESLRQMVQALRPGGCLIVELLPRESLELHFIERDWQRSEEGSYLLSERTWIDGGRKLRAEHTWLGRATRREVVSEIFVYSVPELSALFRRVGLKRVKRFGDFKGTAWRPGMRLVLKGEI